MMAGHVFDTKIVVSGAKQIRKVLKGGVVSVS